MRSRHAAYLVSSRSVPMMPVVGQLSESVRVDAVEVGLVFFWAGEPGQLMLMMLKGTT